MKTIALVLVLVAVASAQLINPLNRQTGGNVGGARGVTGGAISAGHGGVPGFGPGLRNWGPKVIGPGVNNRFALAPNPFVMQRALSVLNSVPGARIYVDHKGEIEFVDRYGREADIIHPSGLDVGELLGF